MLPKSVLTTALSWRLLPHMTRKWVGAWTAFFVAGGSWASFAGCVETESDSEEVDEAESEVAQGQTDTTQNATVPATLRIPPTVLHGNGSATLISRQWVMTAQHVYPNEDAKNVVSETLIAGASSGSGQVTLLHTKQNSGPILTWDQSPLNHRENDLALIRLDAPAPAPWAVPAHPPLVANSCGTSFSGRLAGYGPSGYNENGYSCSGSPLGTRKFGLVLTWEYNGGNVDGATYRHVFTSPPGQGCTAMAGIGVGGDSGGSLYDTSGRLCGVISGDGYWATSGDINSTLTSDYHTVATDNPLAIAWWSQYVLDIDGNFEGDCEAPNSLNDPDGDGIASSCDNCPMVWNPEQLTSFTDTDNDGLGDACDPCSDVTADSAAMTVNRNREVELAIAYPTATVMPVLNRADYTTDADFASARTTYLAAFRPDVCDPHPVPKATLDGEGNLPSTVTFTTDPISLNCVAHEQGCRTFVTNQIEIAPTTSAVVQAAGGSNLTVGMRWCDCKDEPAFGDSLEGRARCRTNLGAGCQFNEANYTTSHPKWLRITTKHDTSGWNAPELGKQWTLAAGTGSKTTYWNFAALGGTHVLTETNGISVTGMLWAHVDAQSNANTGITQANLRKYANSLSDGNGGAFYRPEGALWAAVNDWFDCAMCTGLADQVFYEVGNPSWMTISSKGRTLRKTPDATTRSFFEAVANGTRKHVPASEPIAWFQTAFKGGQVLRKGVGLDASNNVVVRLTADSTESFPVAETVSVTGGPAFWGGQGMAFSATENRLYILGGVAALTGAKRNQGFILDLDDYTWRTFTMPSGEEVGTVLAMIYRREDRSIYFLDQNAGTLRLRRWNAQRKLTTGKLQTLATFPASWNAFAKFSLQAGPIGDIGIVAWQGTSASERTRFGRFTLNTASQATFAGLTKLSTQVSSPPVLLPDRFTYTRPPVTGGNTLQLATSPLTALTTPVAADAPTLLPH